MPERVRNIKGPELLENAIEVMLQLAECGVRQRRRSGLCLLTHEAVGKDEKGIHLILQPVDSQVTRARCENFVTSRHGRNLQIGERNDRLFPVGNIRTLKKGCAFGFPHEPAIRRFMGCENPWHILGEPSRQSSRYKKFVNVRVSDGLEPDGFPVRLEADESKGRTCLKLAEIAIPAEAGRLELRADPPAEFFEGSEFRKGFQRLFGRRTFKPHCSANCEEIARISERILFQIRNRQTVRGEARQFFRVADFHYVVHAPGQMAVPRTYPQRKERHRVQLPQALGFGIEIWSSPLPPRNPQYGKAESRSAAKQKHFGAVSRKQEDSPTFHFLLLRCRHDLLLLSVLGERIDDAMNLQGLHEVPEIVLNNFDGDIKLLTELFGNSCGANALLQQVENLRAYGIEAKHRSAAEVEHDGTVGARCSSHVICG